MSTPSRSRALALGAAAVVAVGLVGAYGSIIGAQSAVDPIGLEVVSVDATDTVQEVPDTAAAAISDTGGVAAYETIVSPPDAVTAPGRDVAAETVEVLSTSRRVWIRDRVGGSSRPVAEMGSLAPGISGDGCLIAYPVVGTDDATASLTVVDRCAATADLPLPLGTVIDTVSLDSTAAELDDTAAELDSTGTQVAEIGSAGTEAAELGSVDALPVDRAAAAPTTRVAAPALSFDGSTIVWSTGREIRRYERPAPTEPHVLTQAFDVAAAPSPDVVTGAAVDVSADGRTVVFLAGPGPAPFAPTPANAYLWTVSPPTDPELPPTEPELLSPTATGEASTFDAASPTISADGAFVVFESTGTDLAVLGESAAATPSVVVPFVVGVDRTVGTAQILVDDATRPALSADGNHVVYQRGDAIRLLSSDTDSVADLGLAELVAARPTGPIAISQYGRWLVFASAENLSQEPAELDSPPSATTLWAADRTTSNPDVVDTTTTTTTTTTTDPPVTTAPPTTPTTAPTTVAPPSTVPEAGTSPTVPVTTLAPTPITPRFPSTSTWFPPVNYPTTPSRSTGTVSPTTGSSTTSSSSTGSAALGASASSSPVTFEPTVIVAGRRSQPVTLVNATSETLDVTATSITPTGAFSIVSDGCTGIPLAPRATCAVEVQFAPVEVGVVSAVVTFQLDDGSVVTASLDGEGVPNPVLDLVPEVAGAGQTVTVFGSGFPAGSTVELMQPGFAMPQPVVVDADGTFAHVVVVLPHTPTGPVVLSVAGQPDAFGDVETELLVSSRGTSSSGAALRSVVAG